MKGGLTKPNPNNNISYHFQHFPAFQVFNENIKM